jgi:voltage-gated potassium channel
LSFNRQIAEYLNRRRRTLRRFYRTIAHSNLPRTMALLILIYFGGSLAVMIAEKGRPPFNNFLNAAYWAIVTMSTTGYGDMVPITPTGRVITGLIIIGGLAMTAIVTATVSSIFVAAKIREGKGLEQINYRGHLVICGWSYITNNLLAALTALKDRRTPKVVLIADIPGTSTDELMEKYESLELRFVRGDWTHEEILRRAGLADAATIVILPDESLCDPVKTDEKTILATLTAKGLNPKIKLVAHIERPENRVFLKHANADEIIVSDELNGYLIAAQAVSSGIPQLVREMLTAEGDNRLAGQSIPTEFVGGTFAALSDFVFKKGAILIGLIREETPLEAADILSADTSALDEFIHRKFQEAGLDAAEKARTRVRLNPARDTLITDKDLAVVIGGGKL